MLRLILRSRTIRWLGVALLLAVVAKDAEAQRRCTKGIPCGGSCISATKTCRVGSSSEPARDPTPVPSRQPALPVRTDTTAAPLALRTTPSADPDPRPIGAWFEFAAAMRGYVGWSVTLKNSPNDDKSMRSGQIAGVASDHFTMTANARSVRIPFSALAMVVVESEPQRQLVVVFAR